MKVVSIFRSLDGEVTAGGPLQWAIFIRFAGCNLRCYKNEGYCDAPHALEAGKGVSDLTPKQIVKKVMELAGGVTRTRQYNRLALDNCIRRITLTGGEPLLPDRIPRLKELMTLMSGFQFNAETNGSVNLLEIRPYLHSIIMDIKLPSTSMHGRLDKMNISLLRAFDFIKMVVADENDLRYIESDVIPLLQAIGTNAQVAIGPKMNGLTYTIQPARLVDFMDEHALYKWRLNLQLHKIIWPEKVLTNPIENLNKVDIRVYRDNEV